MRVVSTASAIAAIFLNTILAEMSPSEDHSVFGISNENKLDQCISSAKEQRQAQCGIYRPGSLEYNQCMAQWTDNILNCYNSKIDQLSPQQIQDMRKESNADKVYHNEVARLSDSVVSHYVLDPSQKKESAKYVVDDGEHGEQPKEQPRYVVDPGEQSADKNKDIDPDKIFHAAGPHQGEPIVTHYMVNGKVQKGSPQYVVDNSEHPSEYDTNNQQFNAQISQGKRPPIYGDESRLHPGHNEPYYIQQFNSANRGQSPFLSPQQPFYRQYCLPQQLQQQQQKIQQQQQQQQLQYQRQLQQQHQQQLQHLQVQQTQQQVQQQAQRQAQLQAQHQAQLQAQHQAQLQAQHQAQLQAQRQAQLQAQHQAQIQAQRQAQLQQQIQQQQQMQQQMQQQQQAQQQYQQQQQEAQQYQQLQDQQQPQSPQDGQGSQDNDEAQDHQDLQSPQKSTDPDSEPADTPQTISNQYKKYDRDDPKPFSIYTNNQKDGGYVTGSKSIQSTLQIPDDENHTVIQPIEQGQQPLTVSARPSPAWSRGGERKDTEQSALDNEAYTIPMDADEAMSSLKSLNGSRSIAKVTKISDIAYPSDGIFPQTASLPTVSGLSASPQDAPDATDSADSATVAYAESDEGGNLLDEEQPNAVSGMQQQRGSKLPRSSGETVFVTKTVEVTANPDGTSSDAALQTSDYSGNAKETKSKGGKKALPPKQGSPDFVDSDTRSLSIVVSDDSLNNQEEESNKESESVEIALSPSSAISSNTSTAASIAISAISAISKEKNKTNDSKYVTAGKAITNSTKPVFSDGSDSDNETMDSIPSSASQLPQGSKTTLPSLVPQLENQNQPGFNNTAAESSSANQGSALQGQPKQQQNKQLPPQTQQGLADKQRPDAQQEKAGQPDQQGPSQGNQDTPEMSGPFGIPGTFGMPGMQGSLGPFGLPDQSGTHNITEQQTSQRSTGQQGQPGQSDQQYQQGQRNQQTQQGPQNQQSPQGQQGPQGQQSSRGQQGPQDQQRPQNQQNSQSQQGPQNQQNQQNPQSQQGPQSQQSQQNQQNPQGQQGPQNQQGQQGQNGQTGQQNRLNHEEEGYQSDQQGQIEHQDQDQLKAPRAKPSNNKQDGLGPDSGRKPGTPNGQTPPGAAQESVPNRPLTWLPGESPDAPNRQSPPSNGQGQQNARAANTSEPVVITMTSAAGVSASISSLLESAISSVQESGFESSTEAVAANTSSRPISADNTSNPVIPAELQQNATIATTSETAQSDSKSDGRSTELSSVSTAQSLASSDLISESLLLQSAFLSVTNALSSASNAASSAFTSASALIASASSSIAIASSSISLAMASSSASAALAIASASASIASTAAVTANSTATETESLSDTLSITDESKSSDASSTQDSSDDESTTTALTSSKTSGTKSTTLAASKDPAGRQQLTLALDGNNSGSESGDVSDSTGIKGTPSATDKSGQLTSVATLRSTGRATKRRDAFKETATDPIRRSRGAGDLKNGFTVSVNQMHANQDRGGSAGCHKLGNAALALIVVSLIANIII